ncbi:MAG: hypothetical protein DMG15_00795 [Acidobacteria bacterium]|nr:MAG: hypothetical protein DMG15_00795 [Acidobacteriota bacterium]
MVYRRLAASAGIGCVVFLTAFLLTVPSYKAADTLPRELTDDAYWKMVSDFSEQSGSFRFEYMSNELQFQYVIPRLKENRKPGGVYLGVGPEQNFTYIAAIQPKIAFIFDIRRQNTIEHLIYKALFEMSSDRTEFLSRLFSRRPPQGLTEKSTARQLFQAFRAVPADADLYRENLQVVKDRLMKQHRFPFSQADQESIDFIYRIFFDTGSVFGYSASVFGGFGGTYADLMTATDQQGQARSYLASEENFQVVRELERKNLIIPIVGDFAGPKALRNVARYIKEHGGFVTAFYTSNVEQYLFQQGDDWRHFLINVSAFPMDPLSTFIRSSHFAYGDAIPARQFNRGRFIQLLSPMAEVVKAFNSGQLTSYEDLIRMSK